LFLPTECKFLPRADQKSWSSKKSIGQSEHTKSPLIITVSNKKGEQSRRELHSIEQSIESLSPAATGSRHRRQQSLRENSEQIVYPEVACTIFKKRNSSILTECMAFADSAGKTW
jgi:hypothetical protein